MFLEFARNGRRLVRDYYLMLVAYPHGLRVWKLIDIHLQDLDLEIGWMCVRRPKGSLSIHQLTEKVKLWAIKTWLREYENCTNAKLKFYVFKRAGKKDQTIYQLFLRSCFKTQHLAHENTKEMRIMNNFSIISLLFWVFRGQQK